MWYQNGHSFCFHARFCKITYSVKYYHYCNMNIDRGMRNVNDQWPFARLRLWRYCLSEFVGFCNSCPQANSERTWARKQVPVIRVYDSISSRFRWDVQVAPWRAMARVGSVRDVLFNQSSQLALHQQVRKRWEKGYLTCLRRPRNLESGTANATVTHLFKKRLPESP